MKRYLALLSCALLLGLTHARAIGNEHHINATLETMNDSGVSGTAHLTQLPHGGAVIKVEATGLKPGQVYTSFYYESSDCTEPADKLVTFTAGSDGTASGGGKIDDDLDEVGSVSIRLGEGYGTLQACADVHGGH